MGNIEKIEGDAILQLFKKLQQEKIPLKVKLTNGDFEHLSHIKKIRKRLKSRYFLIEYSQDFLAVTENLDNWRLRIEFIANDGIKYAFQTKDNAVLQGMIWMKFPESVHRYQRRSLFRLEAPSGTQFYFTDNEIHYKLEVINVSLGGTLGVLVRVTGQLEQELKFNTLRIIENGQLVFPSKADNEDDSKVSIKQCQIVRKKRNPQTDKHECAIEFKKITENEQNKLTEMFYRCQRDYLRQRRLARA
jgi:c-di-GMP-binding flagellar brake protein YcgR